MRKYIILLIFAAAIAFSQTEVNWWVFDGGGGMRSPASGDTLYASIGQGAIGFSNGGTAEVSAGYLYGVNGLVKIDENDEDLDDSGDETKRPYVFGINSISPNPFNPTCKIEFEVEDGAPVTFEFYDMLGRVVDSPIRGEVMAPGKYQLTWGGDLPSGTYFARLTSNNRAITKRVVYLK